MNKEFIKQRITIFSGTDFDPMDDDQVIDILQRKLNIFLPQRPSLDDSLASASSDHEIIQLLIQYRTTENA